MIDVLLPYGIPDKIVKAYLKDLQHLCELGLINLRPEGVEITPRGRTYLLQSQRFENGKSE